MGTLAVIFICWKWKPVRPYRSTFTAEHVNTLASMIGRHYQKPHQVVCVTDAPVGIDPSIRIVPLWDQHADIPSPLGLGGPSCYRRLRMFSADAGEMFGPRFMSMDLDTVVTADLSPIVDREEDFVCWGDTNPRNRYNGSLMLLRAGTRTKVWDTFDPVKSPRLARAHIGSDQAWLCHVLGKSEPIWTAKDGIYSFRNQVNGKALPGNARVVAFHGKLKPWSPEVKSLDWIQEHYR